MCHAGALLTSHAVLAVTDCRHFACQSLEREHALYPGITASLSLPHRMPKELSAWTGRATLLRQLRLFCLSAPLKREGARHRHCKLVLDRPAAPHCVRTRKARTAAQLHAGAVAAGHDAELPQLLQAQGSKLLGGARQVLPCAHAYAPTQHKQQTCGRERVAYEVLRSVLQGKLRCVCRPTGITRRGSA